MWYSGEYVCLESSELLLNIYQKTMPFWYTVMKSYIHTSQVKPLHMIFGKVLYVVEAIVTSYWWIHLYNHLCRYINTVQPLLNGHPRGMDSDHLIEVKAIEKPSSGLWLLAA